MSQLPGPWRIETDRIVASDGSLILWWANPPGVIVVAPERARLLLAVPRMLDLMGRLDGLLQADRGAAKLCAEPDHLRALGEIEDLVHELDGWTRRSPSGKIQTCLNVGTAFRFQEDARWWMGHVIILPGSFPDGCRRRRQAFRPGTGSELRRLNIRLDEPPAGAGGRPTTT